MCGSVLDSSIVCGNQKSIVCENVLDSIYNNISVTEGGKFQSSCVGDAIIPVCGNDDSTVCHMSECASSGIPPHEKNAPDGSGCVTLTDSAEGEADYTEVTGPDDVQALTTFWEIEEGQTQVTDVQGRLGKSLKFWEDTLDPAPWIISCVKEGYKLPLHSIPDHYHKPNQQSALRHQQFVQQAIQELEQNRCVVKVQEVPHICSPLSVVANTQGKLRLVLNLRYLNQFLWTDRFKYEDLRVAMLMFQKGDYLFSFDLKSGYHHVDIYEPHRQYLGFSWEQQGLTQFYVFSVLPFGLATACYAFTKLLRPLVKYWRSQGLRALLYLDDGIVAVKGKQQAEEASHKVRQDLVKVGLVEHTAKCSWVPSQQARWLGFNLDLQQGVISVPEEKIAALKLQLIAALDGDSLKARDLANIIGKIISMALATGPVSRLMTRRMYALLNSRIYWCQMLEINLEARSELEFWLNQVDHINGHEIWHSPWVLQLNMVAMWLMVPGKLKRWFRALLGGI